MSLRTSDDTTAIALIEALQNPALFDHSVEHFEVIETHISWVLLTGPYAYKIKKPVNLGFLDFSTLEKRRFFCLEELRLNRRLAPDLYVDVVPITGAVRAPSVGGAGPAIEYAVKMRQFPHEAQLDRMLARGEVSREHIDALAREVAAFHARAAVAGPDTPFGTLERVHTPVVENFEPLQRLMTDSADLLRLDGLRAWSEATYAALADAFSARKTGGFIRECHGDLHLANIAWVDQRPLIFDGIEFNENLRWIDVMSEAAFLTMDLDDRGAPQFARRWLNAYLELTGDYAGLRILQFYQVYRALVRAKVAWIRGDQAQGGDRERCLAEGRGYLDLAKHYTATAHPALAITYGLSGSGKSTLAQGLVEAWGAVRVRSDVERKRLYGFVPQARTTSTLGHGLYGPEAGAKTYARLADLARHILDAGYSVIVDASFLRKAQRAALRAVAVEGNVPFVILDTRAPEVVLRARIVAREQEGRDASEAGLAVLDLQHTTAEALDPDERCHAFTVETEGPLDFAYITADLERMIKR